MMKSPVDLIHCMFYCSRQKLTNDPVLSDGVLNTNNLKKLSEAEQVELLQQHVKALEKRSNRS